MISIPHECQPSARSAAARFGCWAIPFAVTIGLVAATTGLRWVLDEYLAHGYVLTIYFLPVVAGAFYGGTRQALFATALGWFAGMFFFVEPRFAFFVQVPTAHLLGSGLFLIVGVSIAIIAGRMSTLRWRAERESDVRGREIVRLAERLRFSDRLTLVGTLAAGLGHDIANVLLPMRARISAVESTLTQAGLRVEEVEGVRVAAEYLANLARGLSYLVTNPHGGGDATNVAKWVQTVGPLLRSALPRGAEIVFDVPDDLPNARISATGLTQAVFNAVQNAGKALSGCAHAGRVEVMAERGESEGTVRVLVRDNGPGMSEETLAQINEPTVRAHAERGVSGLGFAIIMAIVSQAGGSVSVRSEPGRGTEVRFDLPAVELQLTP